MDAATVALGFSGDDDTHRVSVDYWTALDSIVGENLIEIAPTRLTVPVVNRSDATVITSIFVDDGRIVLADEDSPLLLTGMLSIDGVVQAVVVVGGGAFDEEGARAMVAGFLGVDPDDLPSSAPFTVEFTLAEEDKEAQ